MVFYLLAIVAERQVIGGSRGYTVPHSTHPLAPSLPQKDAGKRGEGKSEAGRRKGPRPAPACGNQIGDGLKKLFAPGAGKKDESFPQGGRKECLNRGWSGWKDE